MNSAILRTVSLIIIAFIVVLLANSLGFDQKTSRRLDVELRKVQKPGSAIMSRSLPVLKKQGIVREIPIEATPEQKRLVPVFEKRIARPIVRTAAKFQKGRWLDSERTAEMLPFETPTDVCVQNCAQLLLPLHGLEMVKDESGSIQFPVLKSLDTDIPSGNNLAL